MWELSKPHTPSFRGMVCLFVYDSVSMRESTCLRTHVLECVPVSVSVCDSTGVCKSAYAVCLCVRACVYVYMRVSLCGGVHK